jgi:hypothetical protein
VAGVTVVSTNELGAPETLSGADLAASDDGGEHSLALPRLDTFDVVTVTVGDGGPSRA